jgi:hypothetical protein
MYCKIAEEIIKTKRLTDVEYIKYLEHQLHNTASRINYYVAEMEHDLELTGGQNLKQIYLEHGDCLTRKIN